MKSISILFAALVLALAAPSVLADDAPSALRVEVMRPYLCTALDLATCHPQLIVMEGNHGTLFETYADANARIAQIAASGQAVDWHGIYRASIATADTTILSAVAADANTAMTRIDLTGRVPVGAYAVQFLP